MVKRYQKRPVIIDALQWTGKNLKEVIEFIQVPEFIESSGSLFRWKFEDYEKIVEQEGLKIYILEGTMQASINDMIIKGVDGEFYPCKPDIFKKTYIEI